MNNKKYLQRLAAITLAATIAAAGIPAYSFLTDTSSGTVLAADSQSQTTPPDGSTGGPGDGSTPPAKPDGEIGGTGGPGGQSSSSVEHKGATEITSKTTESGTSYSSTTSGENALLVNTSDTVTLKNIKASKTGDGSNSDDVNFYGTNSAVLAMGGTTTNITGAEITTSADGANGVFSYGGNGGQNGAAGDGTTVNISDSTITTTGDSSGGIMTTGGGTTNATNLTVTTSGQSSASIRSDRGGGTVNVDGGTYSTSGVGSPAIYSTAATTVKNSTLISSTSEGAVIEGKNSIVLENCNLSANNTEFFIKEGYG